MLNNGGMGRAAKIGLLIALTYTFYSHYSHPKYVFDIVTLSDISTRIFRQSYVKDVGIQFDKINREDENRNRMLRSALRQKCFVSLYHEDSNSFYRMEDEARIAPDWGTSNTPLGTSVSSEVFRMDHDITDPRDVFGHRWGRASLFLIACKGRFGNSNTELHLNVGSPHIKIKGQKSNAPNLFWNLRKKNQGVKPLPLLTDRHSIIIITDSFYEGDFPLISDGVITTAALLGGLRQWPHLPVDNSMVMRKSGTIIEHAKTEGYFTAHRGLGLSRLASAVDLGLLDTGKAVAEKTYGNNIWTPTLIQVLQSTLRQYEDWPGLVVVGCERCAEGFIDVWERDEVIKRDWTVIVAGRGGTIACSDSLKVGRPWVGQLLSRDNLKRAVALTHLDLFETAMDIIKRRWPSKEISSSDVSLSSRGVNFPSDSNLGELLNLPQRETERREAKVSLMGQLPKISEVARAPDWPERAPNWEGYPYVPKEGERMDFDQFMTELMAGKVVPKESSFEVRGVAKLFDYMESIVRDKGAAVKTESWGESGATRIEPIVYDCVADGERLRSSLGQGQLGYRSFGVGGISLLRNSTIDQTNGEGVETRRQLWKQLTDGFI